MRSHFGFWYPVVWQVDLKQIILSVKWTREKGFGSVAKNLPKSIQRTLTHSRTHTNKKTEWSITHYRPYIIRRTHTANQGKNWLTRLMYRLLFPFPLCLNLFRYESRWIDFIQCVACVMYVNKCCELWNGSKWFSGCYVKLRWQTKKKSERGWIIFSSSLLIIIKHIIFLLTFDAAWDLNRSSLMFEKWNQQQPPPTNDKVIAEQMRSVVFGFRHRTGRIYFCFQTDSIRGNRVKISHMLLFSTDANDWFDRKKRQQKQKKGSTLVHIPRHIHIFIDTINPFSTNFMRRAT